MRGIILRVFALCMVMLCILCLASCTQVINSPSDELRMYRWTCEQENGCFVSLSFEGTDALLHIENDVGTTDLDGLCVTDDDSLTICDTDSDNNYTFGYRLYGDRVELYFNDAVLTLNKTDTVQ